MLSASRIHIAPVLVAKCATPVNNICQYTLSRWYCKSMYVPTIVRTAWSGGPRGGAYSQATPIWPTNELSFCNPSIISCCMSPVYQHHWRRDKPVPLSDGWTSKLYIWLGVTVASHRPIRVAQRLLRAMIRLSSHYYCSGASKVSNQSKLCGPSLLAA